MGALTLKSFPFELRGWDIKSHESIDPTDSFGQSTRIYIENNRVIKIEPSFSNESSHTWITDKGRHFFDSLFEIDDTKSNNVIKSNKAWEKLFKVIHKSLYTFNMCNLKTLNKHFFVIIFEFLSLESLNLLYTIAKAYPFIKLARTESFKINNNLESELQVNSLTNKAKLFSSSLCLLLGVNTRYENSHINLKLRQRSLKGNFKVLAIGSLFDFTFPVSFLGSNFSSIKTIIEGNNTTCQDFKTAENPMLITNTDFFKRADSKNFINLIKILKFTNIISKTWNGINILNSHIAETGTNFLSTFPLLKIKDLLCINSIYIINVNIANLKNLKNLTELKLTQFVNLNHSVKVPLLIDQNNQKANIFLNNFQNLKFKKYIYLPNGLFFENNETFINTAGMLKQATKLVFNQKTKSNWQLIRKFAKKLEHLNSSSNCVINFNTKSQYDFKNFMNFQFYATQSLTDLNFYLNTKNNLFVIYKKFSPFKAVSIKTFNTKIKYWLDDFFNGGKDNYCQNSLTLTNCSANIRTQMTNFF